MSVLNHPRHLARQPAALIRSQWRAAVEISRGDALLLGTLIADSLTVPVDALSVAHGAIAYRGSCHFVSSSPRQC